MLMKGRSGRSWTTSRLVWLACLLPLLALLSSQFAIYCDEQGDCSPAVRLASWLLWPLVGAWVVVLVVLASRGARKLASRARRPQ
jgi:hypothetical protein